MKEKTETKELI